MPSNPWLAVGWCEREAITFPIRPYLEKKGIDFVAQRVERIDAEGDALQLQDGTRLAYDYLVITTGPKLAFDEAPGAGPEQYRNIFSAGVCIAIPPVEATPVPTGAPKTGYMIETMVTAIVHNIADELAGKTATNKGSWNAICLADMGDTGAAFVALPQIPPRNVNWFRKGKWVHLAKIAYEKYFLFKMKSGSSEPVYEKHVLKLLGIERLER